MSPWNQPLNQRRRAIPRGVASGRAPGSPGAVFATRAAAAAGAAEGATTPAP
jgi:hypothetical protein